MNHVELKAGELTAIVGDNTAHGEHCAGYNGLWSLTSVHEPKNIFVPFYAGLNLEHIFDGRPNDDDFFEPRKAPMQLVDASERSATLHQPPTYRSKLESWTTFRLSQPHSIDFEFRCVAHENRYQHDYVGLFWASYINGPLDKGLYFPRDVRKDGGVVWQQFCTQWHNRDSSVLHRGDSFALALDPRAVSLYAYYSQVRYALPFYYGRFRDMVLIYMFDRSEGVRFTHSPSGGGHSSTGDDTNPAWDFQFIIHPYEIGKQAGFKLRAVYKRWEGREDVLRQFETFQKAGQ